MPPRKHSLGLTPYRKKSPAAEAALDTIGPSAEGQEFYARFMTELADGLVAWLLDARDHREAA